MTPKEKAKELIEKYTFINGNSFFAKDCAIIAVDEILSLGYVGNEPSSFRVYKFYSDVKSELELELKN